MEKLRVDKPEGTGPPKETDEHRYLRETRTATVFIAWIVAVLCILGLIGVIVTGVELNKLANPGGSSDCTNSMQELGIC